MHDYQESPNTFIRINDTDKIKWNRSLEGCMKNGKASLPFTPKFVVPSVYRPFIKQFLYQDFFWIEMRYQIPKIFPYDGAENLVISVSGVGNAAFSTLMSDQICDSVDIM